MATTEQIFSNFNDAILHDILSNYVKTGAKATGKTGETLRAEATANRNTIFGGGAFIDDRLEKGSKKGTVVPLRDLVEWCKAKGVPIGMAGRIQRNIFKYGTVTVNEQHPREIYSNVVTPERIKELISQLSDVQLKEVVSDIMKQFKQ